MSAPTIFDYQPFFSSQQRHRAVGSRAVVEQARGMLMLLYGLEAEQAFEVLRLWAKATESSVGTVAQTLVDAVRLLDDHKAWDRMVRQHVEAAVGRVDSVGSPLPRRRLTSSRARLRTAQ